MNIGLKKYEDSLAPEWDNFIENNSLNGTFLHTRKFYNHNPLNKHDDNSYIFYNENKIIGLIPFNLLEQSGNRILHSYLRATYGGFIISKYAGLEEVLEMVNLLIKEAKTIDINEIVIRNPFRIFNEQFCDESDYAMWYHGFSIKFREMEIAIKLGNKSLLENGYSASANRSIKKGNKHLIVTESFNFERFWKILDRNLTDKHNSKPTHDYESFLILLKFIGSHKIKLFVATYNTEIIAGILVFIVNENAIHAQYIASDFTFQEYRPLNVVIDYIVKWGCDKGFKYFNLGMVNEQNGKIINNGLARFKEGFGGHGVLRETMHLIVK